MAGANLSDDVALLAQAVGNLFRIIAPQAGLRRTDVSAAAKSAGISGAQAHGFLMGTVTLPPHQSTVLVTTVLERWRLLQAHSAEMRASSAVPADPADLSEAAALEAVAKLRKDFPRWRIEMPQGAEKLGAAEAVRLVWMAELGTQGEPSYRRVVSPWHADLRRQLDAIEAAEKERAERARRGETRDWMRV